MTQRVDSSLRNSALSASFKPFLLPDGHKAVSMEKAIRDYLIAEVSASKLSETKKSAAIKTYQSADFPLSVEQATTLSKKALQRQDSFLGLFANGAQTTTLKNYLVYMERKEKTRIGIVSHYLDIERKEEEKKDKATGKPGHGKDQIDDMNNRLLYPGLAGRTKIDIINDLSYIIPSSHLKAITGIIKREMKTNLSAPLRNGISKGYISIAELLDNL